MSSKKENKKLTRLTFMVYMFTRKGSNAVIFIFFFVVGKGPTQKGKFLIPFEQILYFKSQRSFKRLHPIRKETGKHKICSEAISQYGTNYPSGHMTLK